MPVRISNKQKTLIECLLLLVLATTLRSLFIGKTDLGVDESFTLYMAQLSIPDIVKILCDGDNPPLWEILLHGWIKLFGISETAIRSLSLIFNVLTVIPIYFIGEKHLHRFAGIAAAICYCCSNFSIFMAHECRVYSLIGFTAACSAWLFRYSTVRCCKSCSWDSSVVACSISLFSCSGWSPSRSACFFRIS